jgi:atypical dual specificity phosphatase
MDFSWIELGSLAAGSVPFNADNIHALHNIGIRAILSLTERPMTAFREITPQLLNELDIAYFHVPVPNDQPPTFAQAREIVRIINQVTTQNRPLYVHCQAGVGPTGTVLCLYYLVRGKSLDEAQAILKARRVQSILLTDEQRRFLKEVASVIARQ